MIALASSRNLELGATVMEEWPTTRRESSISHLSVKGSRWAGPYHSQNGGEGIEDRMDEYRRHETTASVSEFPRKEPEHEGRPCCYRIYLRWISPNKRATIIAA